MKTKVGSTRVVAIFVDPTALPQTLPDVSEICIQTSDRNLMRSRGNLLSAIALMGPPVTLPSAASCEFRP